MDIISVERHECLVINTKHENNVKYTNQYALLLAECEILGIYKDLCKCGSQYSNILEYCANTNPELFKMIRDIKT